MKLKFLRIIVILLFLTCLSTCPLPALFAQNTPDEGEMLPDLKLSLPQTTEQREYLHVDRDPFLLSEVDCEILIIEVFSLYCPYCQKEAPNVKCLYDVISANPEIKRRVKVLGIGAGNSLFEVFAFGERYGIEFPLIPDTDYTVHKMLGEVRTPYFLVLWKKPAGWLVVYSRVGGIGDPRAFLEQICAKTSNGGGK